MTTGKHGHKSECGVNSDGFAGIKTDPKLLVKNHYGICATRYKLIHFYCDIDAWELYDLKNGPTKMDNLIHDKRYSDRILKLNYGICR
jgi:hypothetical protein